MQSKSRRNLANRTFSTPNENAQALIKNKNLLLFDVLRAHAQRKGSLVIQGVTFENCQFDGPAILLPIRGCNFDDCNFNASDGDMRNLILYPASPDKITGAIAMIDCHFNAVDFFGIGFTGAKDFLDSLLQVETRAKDLQ